MSTSTPLQETRTHLLAALRGVYPRGIHIEELRQRHGALVDSAYVELWGEGRVLMLAHGFAHLTAAQMDVVILLEERERRDAIIVRDVVMTSACCEPAPKRSS